MNWSALPSATPGRVEALKQAGLHDPWSLLFFIPRRYIDRQRIGSISQIPVPALSTAGTRRSGQESAEVTVVGTVASVVETGYARKRRVEVTLQDASGTLKGVWFRGGGWLRSQLKVGDEVAFSGEVKRYGRHLSMAHPHIDILKEGRGSEPRRRIIPVYPSGKPFVEAKITNRLLESWIRMMLSALESTAGDPSGAGRPVENLPRDLLEAESLADLPRALRMIHRPESAEEPAIGLARLKFEEFLLFECAMAHVRLRRRERPAGLMVTTTGTFTEAFFNRVLPFQLTDGQTAALRDIREDLRSGRQMNRLIQGDVGSGKTVVAIGAMLPVLDAGGQAAMMAPTEVLAVQHHHTLDRWLSPLGIDVRLLKGGQTGRLRTDILTSLARDPAQGGTHIVVGTHAVIQEQVEFAKLGLAVIDEQHRFGVQQRSDILSKGSHPHLLVMSATPIPRTLALSLYSDLDITTVKGLPAGRKPVRTAVRNDSNRDDLYRFVEQELREGGQVYVVYPLIEESEALDLKDATAGFEMLQARFPEHSTALLHGRLAPDEKNEIMESFAQGRIRILVSTTVIEVGVDVPNANLMIIEHAERFGLSQLHQLRGRVGRGERASYCVLMHGVPLSKTARFRLQMMAKTQDGFEIAEADLRLRGPGDFLGTRQSGLPEFRFADLVEDRQLLERAKACAWELMERDPDLGQPEHAAFRATFTAYFESRMKTFGK